MKTTPIGPYFVVGEIIYRHWPDSTPGSICDGEKQYGPDFVDRYSTRKAAQRDADTMNKAWMRAVFIAANKADVMGQ